MNIPNLNQCFSSLPQDAERPKTIPTLERMNESESHVPNENS